MPRFISPHRVIAILFALVLGSVAAADAQTSLITNLGQTVAGAAGVPDSMFKLDWIGQAFEVGSKNYSLYSVTLDLPTGGDRAVVRVCNASGTAVDESSCTTLTPGSPVGNLYAFTAGGSFRLSSGNRYWIVLSSSNLTVVSWNATSVSWSGSGATIPSLAAKAYHHSDTIAWTYQDLAGSSPLMFEVKYANGTSSDVFGLAAARDSKSDDKVAVSWMAEPLANVAGFHVWRATREGDPFERITATPIAAKPSSADPNKYVFADKMAPANAWYKLEALSKSGSSEFVGPVKATPAPPADGRKRP